MASLLTCAQLMLKCQRDMGHEPADASPMSRTTQGLRLLGPSSIDLCTRFPGGPVDKWAYHII